MNWTTGSLEKRVFRSYWEDGLLDLFAALGVLIVGVSWAFDFPVGGALAPALLIPLWGPIRQRVIEPRLGRVEFTDDREHRTRATLRAAIYVGLGVLALAILAYLGRDRIGALGAAGLSAGLPAVLLAIMAVLAAILIASPRFVLYAGVLVTAGVAGALQGLEPGRILLEAGAFILCVAVFLLTRFFRANPAEEAARR